MKVLEWGSDGTPRAVELTAAEELLADVHARLVDRGIDQGAALVMLRGTDLPAGLRSEAPALDAALADEPFTLWLAR